MVKLKATLTRKVGPFTVGVWLIILVAGVGIGLLIRRRLGTDGEDKSGFAESGAADQGFPLEGGVNTPGAIVTGFAPRTVTAETPTVDVDRTVTTVGMVEVPRIVRTAVQVPVKPAPAPVKTVAKPPPAVSAPKARVYTVVRGDTLRKISARLLGSEARNIEIRALNPQHTKSWDHLDIGEKLIIPAK